MGEKQGYGLDDLEITRVKVTSLWFVMMEKLERLILEIRKALWTVLSIFLP